jgi:hypothetical protein
MNANTLNGMEGTQTLDDVSTGLLNHKDVGNNDGENNENNNCADNET